MEQQKMSEYEKTTLLFYETHADEYIANTIKMEDFEWLEKFCSFLPDGAKVLDVGCAGGRDSAWFAGKGFDTYGIDFSPRMIEQARAKYDVATFAVMNLLSLDFPDEFFDGIWCSCVLLHISKADSPRAIREMGRVLKPCGVVYLLVKEGTTEGMEKDNRYGGTEKFSSYFTESELMDLLAEHGFEPASVQGLNKKVDNYRAAGRIFIIAQKKAK